MWGRLPKPINGRSIYPLCNMLIIIPTHFFTGKTLLEVIEVRPRLPLILKPHNKIFAANEEVRDIRVAFDKIKESISLAQQKYKRAADKHRKSLEFHEDDWVLL